MSDAGDMSMFSASAGLFCSRSAGRESRSYTLGLRFSPWKWLMATASLSHVYVGGSETWYDQILVETVPTDRVTEFKYGSQGLGDMSIAVWADALGPFFAGTAQAPPEGG